MWVLDPQTTGGMWEELTPSAGPVGPTPAHSQGSGWRRRGRTWPRPLAALQGSAESTPLLPGPALAFPSSPSRQEAGGWAEGPGPAGMLP